MADTRLQQLAKTDRNPIEETEYQTLLKQGGGGGGYDDLLKNLPKVADQVGTINAAENNAFSDYLKYVSGQPTPLDFYTKISEAQGIPSLRKTQSTLQGQIYDLEDSLRRLEPDITANTRQSLVTESQRRGILAEKSKPIIENLGWQSQSLGRVSSALAEANQQALTLTGLAGQGVDRMIGVYKDKLEVVSKQGDRALQAFIKDMDNQINITLAKIHRQEQVDDREAANAFAMMQAQQSFDNQKALELAKPMAGEITEIGGRKYLVNKQTGTKIDLGSSTDPIINTRITGGGGGAGSSQKPAAPVFSQNVGGVNPDLYNYLFSPTSAPSATLRR